MHPIDVHTQLCAVIGHPVRHSLSPLIHNTAFRHVGLNYVYLAFDVTNVEDCLRGMRAMEGFRGLSVTIPHKETIFPYLDEIDPIAQQIGSINTVMNDGGKLYGTNTDGKGTLNAFARAKVDLTGKKVLFIGAGGAVRAVAFAFAQTSAPQQITIVGRSPSRLEKLITDLRQHYPLLHIEKGFIHDGLDQWVDTHEIIIQGTPAGMEGYDGEQFPFPYHRITPNHTIMDMVYRPIETKLIQQARQHGATVILGTEMLVEQAGLQFELWTKHPPPLDAMRMAIQQALEKESNSIQEG